MSRIDDFIAHGLLPFVGREEELERIFAFWRSIPEAQHLRVLLLAAEAGVGKSRLLEESLQTISAERGAVVHVKLYPEAANSLAALISRSLWKSPAGRAILPTQPAETLPAVIAALQRLSRLRPTLLVLEDIHLFPSESIPDLARLFEALADETVSVLCLSRPTTIPAQSVLEAYLIESIRMEGISSASLTQLWRELFNAPPAGTIAERLHTITKGNALAVRSGLRWAIQSGVIAPGGGTGEWRLTGPEATFEQGLRRSAALVAEGMVAHLRKEDRNGAEALAALGEVFAREAAEILIPEFRTLLAELTAQGIIVEIFHPVSPLPGVPLTEPGKGWEIFYPSSSAPLLAFTHSLLHAHLAERGNTRIPALLKLLSGDAPLYSLLPLRILGTAPIPEGTAPDLLIHNIRRISAIAVTLDRTASWKDAADLLKPMFHLLESLEAAPNVSPETQVLWRMNAQHISLSILRRSMESPAWIALHERQLKITEAPQTLLAAQYRTLAHSYVLDRIGFDKTYREGLAIIDDLDDLLHRFAPLRTDISYVYLLESLVNHAFANGDDATIRNGQERTARLLADPNLHPGVRQAAIVRILTVLLKFYTTPQELREREESIAVIEEYQQETDPFYGTSKIQFLGITGRFAQALDLIDPVMRRAGERGLWSNFFIAWNWQIICAAGVGQSFEELTEIARAIRDTIPDQQERERTTEHIAAGYAVAGLLAGRVDQALDALQLLGAAKIPPAIQAMIELEKGNTEILKELESPLLIGKLYMKEGMLLTWQMLAKRVHSGAENFAAADDPSAEVARELVALLEGPVLQVFDILALRGSLSLWQSLLHTPVPEELRNALLRKTGLALEWLMERNAPAYTASLVRLLEELGGAEQAKEWTAKISHNVVAELPHQHQGPVLQEGGTIRVSMLGAICAAVPNEPLAPIRGVRIRTLLGLMVADRMIGTPLNQEEFLTLAGGKESDPEHARKKKNMAVVRLREIIGHHAILTDGPTPQLNIEIMSVDLLEIDGLVRRALEAVRRGTFVRALPLIEEAVTLYGGDVPFPTLYDDFFEAARGDFEGRMRRAVLEIGGGILGLGDPGGTESFLRKAFEALPGDEEIAELLREVLEHSGNRIEAERIRMRMEAAG